MSNLDDELEAYVRSLRNTTLVDDDNDGDDYNGAHSHDATGQRADGSSSSSAAASVSTVWPSLAAYRH